MVIVHYLYKPINYLIMSTKKKTIQLLNLDVYNKFVLINNFIFEKIN